MNDILTMNEGAPMEESNLKNIIYRLVYLQPNEYSDEAIAIGVLYDVDGRMRIKTPNSVSAHAIISQLFDEEMKEQALFSIQILNEDVNAFGLSILKYSSPTDLFKFGPASNAVCDDIDLFVGDLLKLSSSLYRRYSIVHVDAYKSLKQDDMEKELKNSIVRLDPFRGKNLINTRNVKLKNDKYLKIPIFGEKIMGTPISLSTTKPGGAMHLAESHAAKLNLARKRLYEDEGLQREPAIYIYVPHHGNHMFKSTEDSIIELEEVSNAMDVRVICSDDIDELAKNIFYDEQLPLFDVSNVV